MYRFNFKKWKILLVGAVLSALIGCAGGKSYDYQQTAGEMKPGPGAFTGESGELTVYDSKQGGLLPKGDDPKAATAAAQAGKASTGSSAEDKEFQEFQEYQQWKKEKQEFHEYQEWKKSAKDSPDFKEFQEWKEWKSYQEWKKSKGQQ